MGISLSVGGLCPVCSSGALGLVFSTGGRSGAAVTFFPLRFQMKNEAKPKVTTFLEEKVTPLGECSRAFDMI